MSFFFNGRERSPVRGDHPLDEALAISPEVVRTSFDNEEAGEKSPLSAGALSFSTISSGKYANHEEGKEQHDMTQDEVNKLVHNALRRARRATTPKSSPRGSPNRESSTPSPKKRPAKSSTVVKSPDDSVVSKHSVRSPESDTMLSAVEGLQVTTAAASPSGVSRNSSSDVIKRVEEEIANAKKAAEEAQQRLTNAMSSKSSNSWSIDEPQLSPSMELAALLDQEPNFKEEPSDSDMREILNVTSGGETTESEDPNVQVTETSFVVARDMIGEEFSFAPPQAKQKKVDGAESPAKEAFLDANEGTEVTATAGATPTEEKGEPETPPLRENAKAPSDDDSDFIGNIDETAAAGSNKGIVKDEMVDATEATEGIPFDEMLREETDSEIVRTTSSKGDKSKEAASDEEKKEDKQEDKAELGAWNGFISAIIGPKSSNESNKTAASEEDSAQPKDTVAPVDDSTDDIEESTTPVENAPQTPDQNLSPTKTPWWTSPEISEVDDKDVSLESEGVVVGSDKLIATAAVEDGEEVPTFEVKSRRGPSKTDAPGDDKEQGNVNETPKEVIEDPPPMSSKNSSQPDESRDNMETAKRDNEVANHPRQVHFKEPYPPPVPLAKPRPSEEIVRDNEVRAPKRGVRWTHPKPQLQELLLAAKGDSLTRRSNALGALKVLSLKKKNQLTLARTKGFLDAVVTAVNFSIPPDNAELGLVARARAVVTLLHVSEPKDNRAIVLAHPGLPQSLIKVVKEDEGEARAHACGALAMLAKTASQRESMVAIENLVSVLAGVVKATDESETKADETTEGETENEDDASETGSEAMETSIDDDSSFHSDGASSVGSSCSESSTKLTTEFGKPVEKRDSYKKQKEGLQDEFVICARYNACAALAHLSKHCAGSSILNDNENFMDSMMKTSIEFDTSIHTKCIEIICNLTRFPPNNGSLSHNSELLDTLIRCGESTMLKDRVWALRALQNMSSDSSSKLTLATSTILTLLSICAVRTDYDEQVAAVAALYNLSTDAGAVVALTNTRNVVATLVHLAHNSDTSPDVRQMSCDALATIGLWLQNIASGGTAPEGVDNIPLPSHITTGWDRWD